MKIHPFLIVVLSSIVCSLQASSQWTGNDGAGVTALAGSGSNLFAGKLGEGVLRSTDGGTTWKAVNSGLTNLLVISLAVGSPGTTGTGLFAGTYGGGVFYSSNSGESWMEANAGLTDPHIYSLAVGSNGTSGTNLFAGTLNNGLFLSTDNGTSWTPLANVGCVSALAVSGSNVYAGTYDFLFVSTDNGTSWNSLAVGVISNVEDFAIRPTSTGATEILAASSTIAGYGGVYHSTDNFNTWQHSNTGEVFSIAVYDTNVFVGTQSGVFLSADDGTVGIPMKEGMTDRYIACLLVSEGYLLAGTGSGAGGGGGIWRRPLSQMITSTEERTSSIASRFDLRQNYPNPFNPSTTITYELPEASVVRLEVYDMLGREVSVVVNERRDAGVHQITFDGSGLSSGVYLYRLQAGEFVQTRKLVLLQ